ncbi:MAG TPA: hybrid sensor histidine kinase/response regulator [Steroidobacteraceae bacterium]|nr:hybrid sensor histidine kinase/response regulator [Steroidobacteraceae bacterium]
MNADRGNPKSRVKCLIVDDMEANLDVLSALLQRDDVELLRARSGTEALELLLADEVALALLDVQMPEMNGFELAERMRGTMRTAHVPIIFITAGAHDQRRLFRGYEIGAVDFLFKPIEPHVLLSKAEVFFQLYRQQQQLARELEERTERLRLNEMFTAVLGHDLRNPLNTIVNCAHLLERRPDEATARDVAARIVSNGSWMSRMIDDVLDLTRVQFGGGLPIRCEPMALDVLVEEVVQAHRASHPGCYIEISREGALAGSWDEDRLRQVLSNLIGNALEHGAGSDEIRVQLDGTAEKTVTLSIISRGVIPDEVLPRLFDPFQQGSVGSGRGLGLGLYIVQQIISGHGGRVKVQSGVAGRTVFRVTLPRKPAVE